MSDPTNRIAGVFRFDRLFMIAAFVWAALMSLLLWWPTAPHWPPRIAVTAVAVSAGWRLWSQRPLMWLSPLMLIPLVVVAFFSILPGLYMSPPALASFRPNFQLPITQYLSGPAELIVLQFAMFLLALCLALRPDMTTKALTASNPATDLAGYVILAVLAGFVALLVACKLHPGLAARMQTGIGLHALHGIPAVMSFCIAALTWLAAERRSWLPAATIAAGVGCVALFNLSNAKTPAFVAASCLLLYTVLRPPTFRRLCWSAIAALTSIAVSLLVLAELRSNTISNYVSGKDSRGASALSDALVYKLVFRQAESIGCFSNVVERRLSLSPEQSPVYFLSAVVPRVLWDDKPNLSQGDRLATDYCDISPSSVYGPEIVHSGSVTLLGEPVIAAGTSGLLVAQLTLSVALTLATVVFLGGGAIGAITLTALLPWLVDFDQSLSLYLANAVKMFLYMCPGIFFLMLANRRVPLRLSA